LETGRATCRIKKNQKNPNLLTKILKLCLVDGCLKSWILVPQDSKG
jgi:hypothetical protein